MIDIKQREEEELKRWVVPVIKKINKFFELNQGFIIQDIIPEEQQNHYYIHWTKGIMQTLILMGYVKYFSCYNGYKNYVYMPLKKIDLENIYKFRKE